VYAEIFDKGVYKLCSVPGCMSTPSVQKCVQHVIHISFILSTAIDKESLCEIEVSWDMTPSLGE
jgi:hypothetical protein